MFDRPLTSRPPAIAVAWLALAVALEPRDPRRVDASDPRVRYEGRVLVDARRGVRFAWPRSALHLRFRGPRLTALLRDTPFHDRSRDVDALGVQIDGGPLRRLDLRQGDYEYALAEGLSPGVHTLRAVKLTEADVGTVRVDEVFAYGGVVLQARPAPRRRILAIGDSITAGYGVNGPDARCSYDVAYNDVTRAWVSLAADALGAELQVVAWSGRGLVRNYDPDARETIVDLFDRAIPTEAGARYDLRGWIPDDVVLNIGTNDASTPTFDDARFRLALDSFVRNLAC